MSKPLTWDERKRQLNVAKHGLDFTRAIEVLDSPDRWDLVVVRHGEQRTLSLAYVWGLLMVLTLGHTERDGTVRVISLRRASREEREAYFVWIKDQNHET